jgi:predicted nucleotidyltransferase
VAKTLGCSERTLRRSVNEGTLRGRRLGPRRIELPLAEQHYAASHWPLLQTLRRTLRTEPSVRLAVLFGSAAVGEDGAESDVDLLIAFDRGDPLAGLALARRLRRAAGRPVDVVTLAQASGWSSLFADVLSEGRVLVDRDGIWESLRRGQADVVRQAQLDEDDAAARAAAAVAQARERL